MFMISSRLFAFRHKIDWSATYLTRVLTFAEVLGHLDRRFPVHTLVEWCFPHFTFYEVLERFDGRLPLFCFKGILTTPIRESYDTRRPHTRRRVRLAFCYCSWNHPVHHMELGTMPRGAAAVGSGVEPMHVYCSTHS